MTAISLMNSTTSLDRSDGQWDHKRAAYTAVMPTFLTMDKGKPVARTGNVSQGLGPLPRPTPWQLHVLGPLGLKGPRSQGLVQGCRMGAWGASHYSLHMAQHPHITPQEDISKVEAEPALLQNQRKQASPPSPECQDSTHEPCHLRPLFTCPTPSWCMKGPIWDIDSTSKRRLHTSRNHRQ